MDPILDEKELATSWDQVKKDELKQIQLRREQAGLAPDPTQDCPLQSPQQVVGVALSGGGIRSACFNLGFLQALVQRKVMRYVDFLATVSGGGYIGSFFSSLAHRRWREREMAKAPTTEAAGPPEPAAPLPLTPDPERHQQPQAVQDLVSSSRYLNDMPGFFNRYLIGTVLLNLTFVSGVVMVCTLLAYLWRSMDQQAAVNYFIWFSRSFLIEAYRPFFPAMVLFVLWFAVWVVSLFRRGTGATARLSGILLILLVMSLLVGLAIWLGTTNMNVTNVLTPNYVDKENQLKSWPSQIIYPLLGLLLVCLIPFIRPTELLKSGQQSDTPWKRWVFNIAGLALLVGVPFLLVYYIGRHDFAGTTIVRAMGFGGSERWDRDLVSADVLDWEDMLLRVAQERAGSAKKPETPLQPGSELNKYIQTGATSELNNEIKNTVKMVKLNRRDHATFLDYMRAEDFKDKIAAKMNEAIADSKFSYDILKSQHTGSSAEPASDPKDTTPLDKKFLVWNTDIRNALVHFDKLIQMQKDEEKKLLLAEERAKIHELLDSFSARMSNTVMLDKLAKELPLYFKDERIRLKMTPDDLIGVTTKLQNVETVWNDERGDLASKIASLTTTDMKRLQGQRQQAIDKRTEARGKMIIAALQDDSEQYAKETKKIKDLDETIADLDREINQIKDRLNELNRDMLALTDRVRRSREKVYTENPNPYVRDEWHKIFFPTGIQAKAAGHLLLRLFYPENFREIKYVSRPLVIAADQNARAWVLCGSLIFFVVCGSLIDFNYSSLHGYYQSRLQRAFLVRYSPEDAGDEHRDLPLAALKNVEEGQPYHILCGTAETIHGRRLEHRLTAFQFAQLFCGSMELGFAKTGEYCDGRLSLADAMSISGAAVNPMRVENLLVKILLVITNFRLGQWLPHPVRGPNRCFVPFFRIMSALMQSRPTNNEKFVFISDGGFYDNLGIDVLLERRCRLIVASDAGADEKIELADLARLYRLCQDKGIRLVNLHDDKPITMASVLASVKSNNVAICRILYPGDGEGLLFHVKSFLVPPATLDLAQYQVTHAQFPHDATTNQFFDEVQFKCYQQLGWQIGQKVCDDLFPEEWGEKPIQVERLKELLVEKTKPAPPEPKTRTKKEAVQP